MMSARKLSGVGALSAKRDVERIARREKEAVAEDVHDLAWLAQLALSVRSHQLGCRYVATSLRLAFHVSDDLGSAELNLADLDGRHLPFSYGLLSASRERYYTPPTA
jgi:hypothetical protein